MTVITATRVVTPTRVLEPGVVEVDRGRITLVAPTTGPVQARTLVPGFVDLQVNGVDGIDVRQASGSDWDRLYQAQVREGVTTWCPTLTTAPLDSYAEPLARIGEAMRASNGRIAGAHLEGPFLGGMPGAHDVDHIVAVDHQWLADLPECVAVVTLGAEADGALDAIAALAARGVLVAVGHSAATYDEAVAAADAGARLVTHCFNAMPPLHHREPGLVGAALADPRLAVSLIADGVHVHPAVLTVALRAKGRGGVVLVTDSVAGPSRRPDGRLAGSKLTMSAAVRNAVERCGASLEDAVWAASTTPAALLGLADRGRIEPGSRADLVALDADLSVEATWVAGERQL